MVDDTTVYQCPDGSTTVPPGSLPPALPPVDVVALAGRAFASTPWPPINLGWALGNEDRVYVGYRYSLALDASNGWNWDPISASATERDVTATITATPREVVWTMGGVNAGTNNWRDWEQITCQSAGSVDWNGDDGFAWRPDVYWDNAGSDCLGGFFRYTPEPVTITAALTWDVMWTASNGDSDPTYLTHTTDYSRPVTVYEWQIRNTQVSDD